LKLYPDAELKVKHITREYIACCSGCPDPYRVHPDIILLMNITFH